MKNLILIAVASILAASTSFGNDGPGSNSSIETAIHTASSIDQNNADEYCQNHGGRLPTIRELQLWATQYGAKISDAPQNGFYEIDEMDSQGNLDRFYAQSSEYKAPSGKLGQYNYWSSSAVPGHSDRAYFLSGENGVIYADSPRSDNMDNFAVRCVQ